MEADSKPSGIVAQANTTKAQNHEDCKINAWHLNKLMLSHLYEL